MAGVVLTTMNPAYRASELHHAATLIGIKGLVMQARVKSSDYHAILKEAGNIHSLDWVIEVGESVRPTSVPFNDLLVAPPGGYFVIDESASCRDAANIQFTSGTTGSPKGAVLSHYNIVNNAMSFGRRLMISDRDVLVIPLPLYHCFGLNLGVVTTICCRATIVLPSESFDANATLNAIANQRGTLVYGVPTMLLELHLAHTAKGAPVRDIFALRGGGIGGSPCPPELMQKLIRDLKMTQIACAYGMTETSPVSLSTVRMSLSFVFVFFFFFFFPLFKCIEDSVDLRCSTVGRVMPHLEVKIVSEQGAVLPLNSVGEVLVKGYSVMLGYWNNADKTRESIVDGFMKTGDLASCDDRGFFRIVGRSKDMIIRGGENVFPTEVESFLLTMPGVKDAAVIGVPDARLGEEVCAWIRTHEGGPHEPITLDSVKRFCSGKIAHFKTPRFVFVVPEFPLTVTGKVQKNVMRETTQKWLAEKKQQSKL